MIESYLQYLDQLFDQVERQKHHLKGGRCSGAIWVEKGFTVDTNSSLIVELALSLRPQYINYFNEVNGLTELEAK